MSPGTHEDGYLYHYMSEPHNAAYTLYGGVMRFSCLENRDQLFDRRIAETWEAFKKQGTKVRIIKGTSSTFC